MNETKEKQISANSRDFPPKVSFLTYVVKDAHQSAQSFTSIMGVKNWRFVEFPNGDDRLIIGKPNRQMFAMGRLGSTIIELRQPISGKSLWWKFLETNGEGLHHIGYLVADLDHRVSILLKLGAIIQEAGIIDGCHWYCIEVAPGVMVEFEAHCEE